MPDYVISINLPESNKGEVNDIVASLVLPENATVLVTTQANEHYKPPPGGGPPVQQE